MMHCGLFRYRSALSLLLLSSQLLHTRALTDGDLNLNFHATFTDHITPFNISVKQPFLDQTNLKTSLTRFVVHELNQPDFTDGPPTHNASIIASYWASEYDWRSVESEINSQLTQFTTIVKTDSKGNYTYPIPLHFVHHRSPRADAIPLIFVHGWPGSFLEVADIVNLLTHPPNATLPAFHVVAPSIPGYGFSPSPHHPGFGYRQAGATFHALMHKLGYSRYVFQGGDAGDFINRYAAHDFPSSIIAGHSNFWIIPPRASDHLRQSQGLTTPDENHIISLLDHFVSHGWAYGQLHQTRPLRLAAGLTDSPVGLAMWIYDALVPGVDHPNILWTSSRLITWTMMHWIPGPYAAFSLYKNGAADGAISTKGFHELPYVQQPVAISEFPNDLWYRTPLEWARRAGNVKYMVMHQRGGHFPAVEMPEVLVEDIWNFFGDSEISGTGVFGWGEGAGKGEEEVRDEL